MEDGKGCRVKGDYISGGYKRTLYLINVANGLMKENYDVDSIRHIYDTMKDFVQSHKGKIKNGDAFYRYGVTKTKKVIDYLQSHERTIDAVLLGVLILRKIKEDDKAHVNIKEAITSIEPYLDEVEGWSREYYGKGYLLQVISTRGIINTIKGML
jgi:hypothetical protein